MPIGLEVRIDLAVDDENAGRSFAYPRPQRIKIAKRSDRRGTGSVAACNGGKIRIREPDDIDGISLALKVMHLGRVGAVVVDKNAKPQLQAQRGLEIRNRHHEAAIAGAEHGELAGSGPREAEGGREAKTNRLERMAETRCARASYAQIARDPTAEMAGIGGDDAINRQDRVDRLAQRPRIDEPNARFVAVRTLMIIAAADARLHGFGAAAWPRFRHPPLHNSGQPAFRPRLAIAEHGVLDPPLVTELGRFDVDLGDAGPRRAELPALLAPPLDPPPNPPHEPPPS